LSGVDGGSPLITGEVIGSKAQVVYEGETVQIDLSQSNSFRTTLDLEAESVAEGGQLCGPYVQLFTFAT
jgi:hypothetical protein